MFLPLPKEDEYHLKTLRIPLTNEQKEFDDQILSLTKILIDALNEKELAKELTSVKDEAKGIDKLDAFLQSKGVKLENMIQYMRDLQSLRSSGVAHLKGSKYERIKQTFGIGEKNLTDVFDDIMIRAIWTLNSLAKAFLSDSKPL